MKSLLISLVIMLSGTGPWSLADCIRHALENNITVKQSAVTVQQREVELSTAKGRRLPYVSASMGENFSFGRSLTSYNIYENTDVNSTSMSLGAQMPLFDGLSIYNGIEMGKLNLAAATSDLERARDDIRVAVAQAYVQILYNKALMAVAQYQVDIDSVQLEHKTARMNTGLASRADVLSIQATLAKSRLSLTRAVNNFKLSILDLTQLLEIPSPDGFDIAVPDSSQLLLSPLANPDEIYADAVTRKAVVRSEEIRLDYARTNIAKAKGGYLPTLGLSGGIGTNYYYSSKGVAQASFGDQLRNNFSQYVGLTLNIPIFSQLSTRNSVRAAKLSYQNQQLELENVKKSLYKEIQQAYYNALAAQSEHESSRSAAESASHSYDLVREKYENGKANITEYNEAKSRYLEAEDQFLQARYQCLYQTKLLDFYRGADIVF